jgi:hypothetical protein
MLSLHHCNIDFTTRLKSLSIESAMKGLLVIVICTLFSKCWGFRPLSHNGHKCARNQSRQHFSVKNFHSDDRNDRDPQVWSAGYSPNADLVEAVKEATKAAMEGLPHGGDKIDLAIVSVSSLYDGQTSPAILVPTVISTASTYGLGIQNLLGCTTGGIISSTRNDKYGIPGEGTPACFGIEAEGSPGVSVVLALLPDVHLKVS